MLHRIMTLAPFFQLLNKLHIGLITGILGKNNIQILQYHQIIKAIFLKVHKLSITLHISVFLILKVKSSLFRVNQNYFFTFGLFVGVGQESYDMWWIVDL